MVIIPFENIRYRAVNMINSLRNTIFQSQQLDSQDNIEILAYNFVILIQLN